MVGANLSTFGGAVFHPSSLPCGSRSRHSLTRFFPSWWGASETQMVLWSLFFVPQDREGRRRVAVVRETGEGIFHCGEWAAGRRGRHLLQAYLEWSQGVPHRQRRKAIVAKVQFEEWPPHSLFPLWRVEQTWTSTALLICCRKLTWQQCASLVRVVQAWRQVELYLNCMDFKFQLVSKDKIRATVITK